MVAANRRVQWPSPGVISYYTRLANCSDTMASCR